MKVTKRMVRRVKLILWYRAQGYSYSEIREMCMPNCRPYYLMRFSWAKRLVRGPLVGFKARSERRFCNAN